jgi:hypothetical protein
MKLLITIIITFSFYIYSFTAIAGTRTEIKIIDHDSAGSNHRLQIRMFGHENNTDILIFIEVKGSSQLSIISDKQGAPYLAERKDENTWIADFFVAQAPKAIYAIATKRAEYSQWTKKRDLSALKRLGIESRGSINGVLSMLDEFGWIPTGYTFIGVSSLREKGDNLTPNQSNTSNICQTDNGSCPLIEYAPHGERCFCNTPYGPVYGVINPKP